MNRDYHTKGGCSLGARISDCGPCCDGCPAVVQFDKAKLEVGMMGMGGPKMKDYKHLCKGYADYNHSTGLTVQLGEYCKIGGDMSRCPKDCDACEVSLKYEAQSRIEEPIKTTKIVTQIKTFSADDDKEINEWLSKNPHIKVQSVTKIPMYDMWSQQAPTVCNQWTETIVVYMEEQE